MLRFPASSPVFALTLIVACEANKPDPVPTDETDPDVGLSVDDQALTTPEDVAVAFALPTASPDGAALTWRWTGPAHGAVDGAAGAFTYTPEANFFGSDAVEVTATADGVDLATATVAFTVTPVNDAPVAGADALTTADPNVIEVPVALLLGNDVDVDGDELAVVGVSDARSGAVSLRDGVVTFARDGAGPHGFTYALSDGVVSVDGAVDVSFGAENQAPVAGADQAGTAEDSAVRLPVAALLANDFDLDGDPLSVTEVFAGEGGAVALDGDAVVFTPSPDFTGEASFTYTLSDGSRVASGAVRVAVAPVNDAPVPGDDSGSTLEDEPVAFPVADLLANDVDVDGDALTVVGVGEATGGAAALVDGAVVFTPDPDVVGEASFQVVVSDGTAERPATVRVVVTPVNDAPVAADDVATGEEDAAIELSFASLLANDVDVDGDALTVTAVGDAAGGSLALTEAGVRFTPDPDAHGPASFTYTVSDGAATATATVRLTLAPVNDPPVAGADVVDGREDAPVTVPVADLLANDTDVDGDALVFVSFDDPDAGELRRVGDDLVYTPAPDATGEARFTYVLSDGQTSATGAVTVRLAPVGDPPRPADDHLDGTEDVPVLIPVADLLANDVDVDGDALTVVAARDASGGQVSLDGQWVTFVPDQHLNGEVSFVVDVSDGDAAASAVVTIHLAPVGDPPVAVDDERAWEEDTVVRWSTADLLANDYDPDGDSPVLVAVSGASHGEVIYDGGEVIFTPEADYQGLAGFAYTITDGPNFDVGWVSVALAPANDPPVPGDLTFQIVEGTTLTTYPETFLHVATDADGDVISLRSVSDGPHATVVYADGVARITALGDFFGTTTISYVISDGISDVTGTATLVVKPVDDLPIGVDDAFVAAEDTPLFISTADLLGNDVEVDGQALSLYELNDFVGGSVTFVEGGVRFLPAPDTSGPASFTYTLTDGELTDTARVSITVVPVNDAPVAGADAWTTEIALPIVASASSLLVNDVDVESDPLAVVSVGDATHGVVTLTDGMIRFEPDSDFAGDASFVYVVSDGDATAEGVVTVVVAGSTCGNEVVQPGEGCDLGAANSEARDAECRTDCQPQRCGDGVRDAGEACDDGPTGSGDGCTDLCVREYTCGDGVLETGEQCDDGGTESGDGCDADCVLEFCGDGLTNDVIDTPVVELRFRWLAASCGPAEPATFTAGEVVLGQAAGEGACTCTPGIGELIVTDRELLSALTHGENDLGMSIIGEVVYLSWAVVDVTTQVGTRRVLLSEAAAGVAAAGGDDLCAAGYLPFTSTAVQVDLSLRAGEQCDDGNTDPDDGCSASCADEFCGDGAVQASEACDDGNGDAGDGCSDACGVEFCGDGVPNNGEECDDANLDEFDGCTNACGFPICGDGLPGAGEVCDDGNRDNGDGCNVLCEVETICGDEFVDEGEVCDDGGSEAGDGCRADCGGFEICGDGLVDFAAGEQCDEGADVPGDGCDADCQFEDAFVNREPTVVSGDRDCVTNLSNTGRKIAVDAGQNLYVAMICSGEGWLNQSNDRGATWGNPRRIPFEGSVGELAIEGGGAGVAYAVASVAGRALFTRTINGGATWSTPIDIGPVGDNEVSIDTIDDEVYVMLSNGPITVHRSATAGAGFADVTFNISNVFHDVVVDRISGDVFACTDDPSLYITRSRDDGATWSEIRQPPGTDFYSDWAGGNGFLYVVGTNGDSEDLEVIPMNDFGTSVERFALPYVDANNQRALDADALGNAYVASNTGSGVQLDRYQFGAPVIDDQDIRVFSAGLYPQVAALPSSDGAVLAWTDTSEGQSRVVVTVVVYDPAEAPLPN